MVLPSRGACVYSQVTAFMPDAPAILTTMMVG
jgi:hypothetical protein